MQNSFLVTGTNRKAPFILNIHRGDGMVLLAMNWRKGKPPRDFVGFAVEYKEPQQKEFWAVENSIGFPGQRKNKKYPRIPSTQAPFQKFRWVHFPKNAQKDGQFHYRVTPMFMDEGGALSKGEPQEALVALMRDTIPGKVNVSFTRGYVSSQSFVKNFAPPDRSLSGLIPDKSDLGLKFVAKQKNAAKAHAWMGFEARESVHDLLDEAIKKASEVRVIAYDLNLPEILSKLKQLGPRLKIIIDDSGKHADPKSPESVAAAALRKSAGAKNVKRQHMADLQHHKSIAFKGNGVHKVLYGSTNFTWRGFYVQSNNALVVSSKAAADKYFEAFDSYFAAKDAKAFRQSKPAKGWHDLGVPGVDAKVSFSPHSKENGLLDSIAKDIAKAKSSVFFSLAFLGQTKRGTVGPAIGKAIKSKSVYALGIADARVGEHNLGVQVLTPDNKSHVVRASALTGNVPAPFSSEPTGLSGSKGYHRGTRMHHKFVVLDFNTDQARVYLGSHNFSVPADGDNGENLVLVKNRTVATSYMIEALRIYDHYRFRTVQEDTNKSGKRKTEFTLQLPPSRPGEKAWWLRDWDLAVRSRARELFAPVEP
jgi:phosphatidylserine/phosphatidylglycerophosphate/cardiolipin synthase-like enzyme